MKKISNFSFRAKIAKSLFFILVFSFFFTFQTNAEVTNPIKVISPNGGQTYTNSKSVKVVFQGLLGKKHDIDLVKNGVSIIKLEKDIVYTNSMSLTSTDGGVWVNIPNLSPVLNGNDYKIKITCVDIGCPSSYSDQSDTNFSLQIKPVIEHVSSNESEIKDYGAIVKWAGNNRQNRTLIVDGVRMSGPIVIDNLDGSGSDQLVSVEFVPETLVPRLLPGSHSMQFQTDFGISDPKIFSISATGTAVRVLSPNGGETFVPGSSIPVTWKTKGAPVGTKVSIVLERDNGVGKDVSVFNQVTNTENDGYELVSTKGVTAGQYAVLVKMTVNGKEYVDDNNRAINIASSKERFITLTSPNTGGQYYIGNPVNISWSYGGFSNDQKITIALFKNGKYNQTIASNVAISDKTYSWIIPPGVYLDGAVYAIYVGAVSLTGTRTDYSDAMFGIGNISTSSISKETQIANIQTAIKLLKEELERRLK